MTEAGASPEPPDRLAPWAGQGLVGFVQRARRDALEAAGLLDARRLVDGKPGVYVEGNASRFVRRVDVGDGAILGGLCAVHQHCRVGRLAMVGGGAMCAQDVPPFALAQG